MERRREDSEARAGRPPAQEQLLKPQRFPADLQARFAELSGDYNPMHIDEVTARRFLYGTTVAHGVHVVLRALDSILRDQPGGRKALRFLKARFSAPVVTGSSTEFRATHEADGRIRVTATSGGGTAMDLTIGLVEADDPASWPAVAAGSPPREQPAELGDSVFERGYEGSVPLALSDSLAVELLPEAATRLPPAQIAALLGATRIVGMKCPGYHSIFSELDLEFGKSSGPGDRLEYTLADWDPRFRLVTLSVNGGGTTGRLKAFQRPAPRQQPRMSALAEQLSADEFAGQRALVIGGSRGLGEFVAKMLAAGGADICITFHRGCDEAGAIVEEIHASGRSARSLQFDARAPDPGTLRELCRWQPTHLFFFATPTIYHADRQGFSRRHFNALCEIYLDGFASLIEALAAEGCLRYVFNPSTEYLDTLPKGMGEYVAAKAAAEGFCRYLARRHRSIRFVTPRLPRLATDQTADLLSPASAPSVDTVRAALDLQEPV